MKRVIDGTAYNTETASYIVGKRTHESFDRAQDYLETEGQLGEEFNQSRVHIHTGLLQTPGGDFFLLNEWIDPLVISGEAADLSGFSKIIPLSKQQAVSWVKQEIPDYAEEISARIEEPAGKPSVITLRVPVNLKLKIDHAAKTLDKSVNSLVMEMIEDLGLPSISEMEMQGPDRPLSLQWGIVYAVLRGAGGEGLIAAVEKTLIEWEKAKSTDKSPS